MFDQPEELTGLRQRAEDTLADEQNVLADYSTRDLERLVHELRVHQLELEMQNAALRESQAELHSAREAYVRLYNEMPVGYFGLDAEGLITDANLAGAQLLHALPTGLIGRRFHRYVARESHQDLHQFLLRLESMRAQATVELRMQRADGVLFWARVEGLAQEPGDQGWRLTVSDVTTERRVQASLAVSEERYRQLVQYAPAAIYEVDVTSGRILEVNDVMCELTGYSRAELLAMTGFDLIDAEGRALLAERLERAAAGQPLSSEVEYRVITKAGRYAWTQLHTRLLYDDGRPARIFVVAHDVTERKHVDDDLRLIMEGTAAVTGPDFFRALVRHLARLLDARYVLVGRLEEAAPHPGAPGPGPSSVVRTCSVWAGGDWADDFAFDLRDSACAPVARGEECRHVSGLAKLYPDDPLLARWPADSLHALPLSDARGRVQGVLMVMDDGPLSGSPRTDPILAIFANRAAAELARQAAEESLRRHANQQAALYAVASALTATLDPVVMLDQVLALVVPQFEADVAWVTVVGATRDDPPLVLATRGLDVAALDLAALATHLDTCPACDSDDSTGQATLRVVYDCNHIPPQLVDALELHSSACLPLAAHGAMLGMLTLGWRGSHRPDHAQDGLLLAVGHQVGLGLHNVRLYQNVRQIDRLFVLSELGDVLATTLDPEQVAAVALQAVGSVAGATLGVLVPYLDVLGHYPGRLPALDGGWIDLDADERYRTWRPLLDRLAGQHQPPSPRGAPSTVSDDPALSAAAPLVPRVVDEAGAKFLVVPIHTPDQPLADLVLSGRAFGDDDLAVVRAAAGRIAQALHNAELYNTVRRLLTERKETQAQLVHNAKMAALGRFTASVSHEINNPVQAVLGCLGLAIEELDEAADKETVDRYLAIALQELRRIAAILRRMRQYYRPTDKEWDLADVNDAVSAAVELMGSSLKGQGVCVEMDLAQVPKVQIRPDQIHQVLLNLILNASDAMSQGGTLTVRTFVEQARLSLRGPQPAVCVEVRDTGPGIEPDVYARLFEPFLTTKHEGSGMGLYISHGIVEAHGGEIEVVTRPGKGTAVRVWLPVDEATEDAES